MNTIEQLMQINEMLGTLFPYGHSVQFDKRDYAHNPPGIIVQIFGVKSYADAQQIFRDLGVQKRNKQLWNDDYEPAGRTVLDAELAPGIELKVYCSGLPPACRIEKIKERVPKTQTVESGEYIEVERTRVVCGSAA